MEKPDGGEKNHDTFFIKRSHSTEGKARLKAQQTILGLFPTLAVYGGGRTGCDCVKTENVRRWSSRDDSLALPMLSQPTNDLRKSKFVRDSIKIMAT